MKDDSGPGPVGDGATTVDPWEAFCGIPGDEMRLLQAEARARRADGPQMAYRAMAKEGRLPPDFELWDLTFGSDGWTVAHEAAKHGRLPPGFDRWELATVFGRTVAHVAAERGHLPWSFTRWRLADNDGRTVASVAGRNR